MATQAGLLIPRTITAPKSRSLTLVPWKPSSSSFSNSKPINRSIKGMAETKAPVKEAPVGFPLLPPGVGPKHTITNLRGSTGGLLRKAQVEEFYVITWESLKEQILEMPTGGAATMRQRPNLL